MSKTNGEHYKNNGRQSKFFATCRDIFSDLQTAESGLEPVQKNVRYYRGLRLPSGADLP
jgi:hypothetical protein